MSENIKTVGRKEVFDYTLQRHENPKSKNARDRSQSPIISEAGDDDGYILDEIAKLPDLSELYCEDERDTSMCSYDYTEKNDGSKSDVYHKNLKRNRQDSFKLFTDMQTTVQEPSHTKYDMSHLLKYNNLTTTSTQSDDSRHITMLIRQRDNCKKSAIELKNKLKALKLQSKSSKSLSTDNFFKNNNKLQLDLHNKLKATGNVVKMLDEIIEAECSEAYNTETKDRSQAQKQYKYNYEYYDPELHWCHICNVFPQTAKDFLKHLHSSLHQEKSADHIEKPWSEQTDFDEGFPHVPSAPSKRTPIRGLQFYVPTTAWYCKLCKHFMGDANSASNHLKSIIHANKYNEFIEHNPHFETDWISDRQKAYEKVQRLKRMIENEKIVSICVSSDTDSEPTHTKEKRMKKERHNKHTKENTLKTNLEKFDEIDSTRSRHTFTPSDRVYGRSVSREVDDDERRRLEARWKDKYSEGERRINERDRYSDERERYQERSRLCYNERERRRDEEERERRHRRDSRYKHRYRRDSWERERLREPQQTKPKYRETNAKMLPEPEKDNEKPKCNMKELKDTATKLYNNERKKNENIYQLAATWLNNNPLPIYPPIAVPDGDINQYYPYGYPYYMGTGYGLESMMNPRMIAPCTGNSGTSLLGEPPIYYGFNQTFSLLYNQMNQQSKTIGNIIPQDSKEQIEEETNGVEENEKCKQEGNENENNGIEENSIVQQNLESVKDESQSDKDLQEQPPNDKENVEVQTSDNNQNASIKT
ncbi:uncharacterized protein LOC125059185 isoform X2 [Pieris napi]|uniref:uncharacterized protein LOC125059185 isoform X2 n=1 Tax=Pieris napi TaxID=78633 RepID=UPI001FBBBC2F|nr:uncharacterized protein LOC125059185 isoform X2 [Pieris napi]